MEADNIALQERLDAYSFYHCIRLNAEVVTKGNQNFIPQQKVVERALAQVPVAGNRVLDVGCRDGLFSFYAERLGAREVVGIDNDLSRGAVEVLIPHFGSNVQMFELNVYDLMPERFGLFD